MLPRAARLRDPADIRRVGRYGRRARTPLVTVTVLSTPSGSSPPPTRATAVVSRRVGNAVVRNRVRRRLREQLRHRLGMLPPGTAVVVRAEPPAATAGSAELGAALDHTLRRLLAGADARGGPR